MPAFWAARCRSPGCGELRWRLRVAIVHYWLVAMRGGEKVLEAILELYPDADIYTHVADRDALSPALQARDIRTTFISRLPGARRHYQKYLPLMPMALEELDLTAYDLVISSESGPAKGVITRPDAVHICYCHSPMRYLWDHYHLYRSRAGMLTRMVMSLTFPALRMWDAASASRVDHVLANSTFVAKRVRKAWGRHADVLSPPVDVKAFAISPEVDDFYLVAGQLVAYKRVDLAVRAFNAMGRKLVVAGTGEDEARLRAIAGPTIEFRGAVDDATLASLLGRCKALVFPGQEDFGIVPVEAMASGLPVAAYPVTGPIDVLTDPQCGAMDDDLAVAIDRALALSPMAAMRHAARFTWTACADIFEDNLVPLSPAGAARASGIRETSTPTSAALPSVQP